MENNAQLQTRLRQSAVFSRDVVLVILYKLVYIIYIFVIIYSHSSLCCLVVLVYHTLHVLYGTAQALVA